MGTWLQKIRVTELSATRWPANKKRKLLQKAQWSAAYVNDLPDASFLHIEPGGKKDDEGKTTPRSLRHFPVKDMAGDVDPSHLRNALSRISQSTLPAAVRDSVRAKARQLLQQINKTEDRMWIDEASLDEFAEKAAMTKAQKDALQAALVALKGVNMEGVQEGEVMYLRQGLAKMLGFGMAEKSIADVEEKLEAAQKSAAESQEGLTAVIKSALGKLQSDTPAINDAVSELAKAVGETPVFKRLEQLPDDVRAEWAALQKSAAEDRAKLEELRKSLADKEAAAERDGFIAKARELGDLPLSAEALGGLMQVVAKGGDEAAVASFDQLVKSMAEIAKGSPLFSEQGGSGHMPADKSGAFGKIDALAHALVRKSDRPMTIEQARVEVMEQHPELFDQYNENP